MSQVAIFMYTFQNYMKSKSIRKGALSPTGVFFSCPGNSDIATLIWVQDAILGGVTKEFRFSGRLRTQWLLFQRINSQHLHVTSSAIPVPDTHKRVPRSPGCTWCTDMYADKISIHIKKKKERVSVQIVYSTDSSPSAMFRHAHFRPEVPRWRLKELSSTSTDALDHNP